MEKIKEQIAEQIKCIEAEGVQSANIDYLGKLVDVHKDIAHEEYWKNKEEYFMRYRENEYGEYGESNYERRGVPNSGRGRGRGRRYRAGGGYGYGGDDKEEMMENMRENYQGYNESSMYGAEGESMGALNGMLEAIYELVSATSEDAKTQQEAQLVKKWARKIGQI
jgi:hypothetical protein